MKKKVLTLSVKKEWFNMIASGEKTEEYREIKEYWLVRLWNFVPVPFAKYVFDDVGISPKPFTHVLFINGYGDDKPRIEKEIESITIGKPKKGWCPDDPGHLSLVKGAPEGRRKFLDAALCQLLSPPNFLL